MTVAYDTEVWLLRHGEIGSYEGDHGLTARGIAQAHAAGEAAAHELADGSVELLHARSARAEETAAHVGGALRGAGIDLSGPDPDPGFDNFAVAIAGDVFPHDRLRVAIVEARRREDWPPAHPADWEREAHRFAYIHDGGGDPIGWWLTQPTLAYEPPGRVVRRFWRALAALAARGAERVIVCTHSGCMRALAAEAAGRDLGEPANLECIRVRLAGNASGAPAELSYRGEVLAVGVPALEEPAWP